MYLCYIAFSLILSKSHSRTKVTMATRRHSKDLVPNARKRAFTTPPANVVQTSLDSFFGPSSSSTQSNSARKKRVSSSFHDQKRHASAVRSILASKSSSAFGTCPICNNANVPIHRLASHASQCNGKEQGHVEQKPFQTDSEHDIENAVAGMGTTRPPHSECGSPTESGKRFVTPCLPYTEPVPGLYLFENVLTEYEESQILLQLGSNHQLGPTKMNRANSTTTTPTINTWKAATFNGKHYGQRWGVHCNLRTRQVLPEERSLPKFYFDYILPKLHQLFDVNNKMSTIIKGYNPNEMNAIDYYKSLGHSLSAHVDDRHLSKEIIVNVSLAGDCYMTFTPVEKPRASSSSFPPQEPIRVLLPRRCLQILTGPARYQYTHAIDHNDLLHERRVSLTLRESPITAAMKPVATTTKATTWISKARQHDVETQNRKTLVTPDFAVDTKLSSTGSVPWMKPVLVETFRPLSPTVTTENTIVGQVSIDLPPGLYLFPNFITEQEEEMLIHHLDKTDSIPHWSIERHTGTHREKRWGVDHDIWSRQVRDPIHPIPHWIESIIMQRLQSLRVHSENDAGMKKENDVHDKFCTMIRSFGPNDVNAIEYKRDNGHSLAAHIDDRQKHTEPIANLSLAGSCYMEYSLDPTKTKKKSATSINSKNADNETKVRDIYRVHLPRRTLQILSGRARYDYRHGIHNSDLLSERRVSITLRESRP